MLFSSDQRRRANLFLAASVGGDELSAQPTIDEIVSHEHIDAALLSALDVTVPTLIHHGAKLDDLVALGYTAERLVRSAAITASVCRQYSKPKVAVAMLRTPEDAKTLAGTFAATQMGLSNRMLLAACEGCRASAMLVIERLLRVAEDDAPLAGCANHLARLGIDGKLLCSTFGIHINQLSTVLEASEEDLATLGVFYAT
jgi:hypothetical protein